MLTTADLERVAKVPVVGPLWADALAWIECFGDALRLGDLHAVLGEPASEDEPAARPFRAEAANQSHDVTARAA